MDGSTDKTVPPRELLRCDSLDGGVSWDCARTPSRGWRQVQPWRFSWLSRAPCRRRDGLLWWQPLWSCRWRRGDGRSPRRLLWPRRVRRREWWPRRSRWQYQRPPKKGGDVVKVVLTKQGAGRQLPKSSRTAWTTRPAEIPAASMSSSPVPDPGMSRTAKWTMRIG